MGTSFKTVKPGHNCWQTVHAPRASLLVDGANYYAALRNSMLKAERSIYIVGWDIDSRVRLAGDEPPDDGAPERLRDFLTYLARERPDLRVHVLLWDFSILYALEREPIPVLNLNWSTPPEIEVCLDDLVPLGGSHHQKIVTIDDKVAFCGGLDLAIQRWDTRDHIADDERRVNPAGKAYKPFHDIQCVVDGDAARALCDLVAERWENAACKTPTRESGDGDPWPDNVEPDFVDAHPAIARTIAPLNRSPGVFEVEAMYLDMINAADKVLYFENQFFTADVVAEALVEALKAKPELEVILVTSCDPHGFLEAHSMATGRQRFMARFDAADVADRVRLVYPRVANGTEDGQDVLVHAKTSFADDVLFRIGSSNLNNRSMGTDGECDLVFEATSDAEKQTIQNLRNDLLAEHLEMSPDNVQSAIERCGSLRALIDERQDEPRTLKVTDYMADAHEGLANAMERVADPERPSDASQFIGDMLSARPAGSPISGRWLLLISVGIIALMIMIWQVSPLSELTDPQALEQVLSDLRGDSWAYLIVPLGFIIGSSLVFPITAMIAATAFVFPPLSAFIIAFLGSMLGAFVNYAVGMLLGRTFLREMMGKRLNKISRALASKGVLTVVTLRIVPVAPFTLINMVAGASHIKFSEFAVGTLIGLTPGILTMTLIGNRLFELLKNPTPLDLAFVVGAVALWFGVSIAAQRLIRRISVWRRARRLA